ncbi:PPC domain-containing protein [Rubritalea tangerina]|uniref:PPC domain-containing protein n=1 Tax=Rubritalea tangerina TaxID=430798 RepID=A0ABW4ZBQ9_9BACT
MRLATLASPVLCALVTSCLIAPLLAFSPQLNGAYPNGLKRDTSPTLNLHGKQLSKAKALLFYRPGIQAATPEIHSDTHVAFPLTIAADCPIGEHPFRLHCADGTSYQRTLWVSPYPTIGETKEANDTLDQAQEMRLNSAVRGITKVEDLDFYKVHLAKGQRLSAELFAMRLGRKFFDAHLTLFGPDHKVIATSDDTALTKQDPYISTVAKSDGFHYLTIREASYEGSDQSRYLLVVGDYLRPAAVMPPAAQPNKETSFTFILDDGSTHQQTLSPKTPSLFAGADGQTALSPVPITLSPLTYQNEIEPNNAGKDTQPALDLPCAFHGVVQQAGDVDWFRFRGKKDQEIRITVRARTLGSPLDARIYLRDHKAKYLANNDDSNHPDSRLDFKLPADGEYLVNIRDHLGKGSPTSTYRIEVTPRTPSVTASLNREDRNDSQKSKVINIPRGSHLAYRLNLKRDKNNANFTPHAAKLPPGVTLHPITASKSLNDIPIVFSAAPDAPLSSGLFPLTLQSDDKKITAPITETVEHLFVNNQGIYHSYSSDLLTICVMEEAPFTLNLSAPNIPAVQNGTISLLAKIQRKESFDSEVTLFFPWLPPGVSAPANVKIPKGKDSAHYTLSIKGDCKPQDWQLCLSATAPTKQGTVQLSSNLTTISVKPPYLTAKLSMAATTQGVDTQLLCTIDHHTPFAGQAEVSLHGLPDGFTATPVKIDSKTTETSIPITVAKDARTGKHGNLFVHVKVPENKQSIPHNTGHGGTLRVDPPPKKQVANNKAPAPAKPKPTTKKPLSRLEQLRQQLAQ